MAEVYLLLGSNLGKKSENIKNAVLAIGAKIGSVNDLSSLYQSPPWGFQHEEDFINQLIVVNTSLSAQDILRHILIIETAIGRVKNKFSEVYEPRLIDIDILYYDDLVLDSDTLQIPHPQIQNRKFALIPLCEVNPDFVHPVLRICQSELLVLCQDSAKVVKIDSLS